MRLFVLALLASAVVFSPAPAQAQYGRTATLVKRATYANRSGVSPVKPIGHVHSAELQSAEATVYAGGHACGCSSCQQSCCQQNGCRQPLLGSLLDNAADLFISLAPCPRPCRGCVMPAHCCPYPDVNCDPSCQTSPFFKALFPCNKLGCGSSPACRSCTSPTCHSCSAPARSCTSCTSRGDHNLIAPPSPEAELKANPFEDDPPALKLPTASRPLRTPPTIQKASSAQRNWYKTTNRAPITSARQAAPPVFVADDASPIRMPK